MRERDTGQQGEESFLQQTISKQPFPLSFSL